MLGVIVQAGIPLKVLFERIVEFVYGHAVDNTSEAEDDLKSSEVLEFENYFPLYCSAFLSPVVYGEVRGALGCCIFGEMRV
jgi:hypothetical protein